MAPLNSSERKRLRAGLGLMAILTVVAIGVFFLDAAVRATTEGERVTVVVASAPGLRPGSPVWVAGRPVGRVLSIDLRPRSEGDEAVLIRAVLSRGAVPQIRQDAHAAVSTPDLMGPVVVSIDPGSGTAPPWDFADTLRTAGATLDPDVLLALADSLMTSVEALQVEAGQAADVLFEGRGTIGLIREDPNLLRDLATELDRARAILDDARSSSVARFASDTTLGPTTRRVRDRFDAWQSSPERENARRSLEAAATALDGMGERLESVLARIEQGEGTIGRAVMDGEIERQLEALRSSIAKLTNELMADPSRWLKVRVF